MNLLAQGRDSWRLSHEALGRLDSGNEVWAGHSALRFLSWHSDAQWRHVWHHDNQKWRHILESSAPRCKQNHRNYKAIADCDTWHSSCGVLIQLAVFSYIMEVV